MTIPAAALRAECVELATAIKPYCNLDIELLTNLILHFAQAREAAVWREVKIGHALWVDDHGDFYELYGADTFGDWCEAHATRGKETTT